MREFFKNLNRMHILIGALVLVLVLVILLAVAVSGTNIQITLAGDSALDLPFGQPFTDPGATAQLSGLFGNRDLQVTADSDLDTTRLGSYNITYEASFFLFRSAAVRTVRIVDKEAPTIVLTYSGGSVLLPGQEYVEEGFVAEDNYDGIITDKVQRQVLEDKVIYTVSDSSGNTVTIERPLEFQDVTPPELTLKGEQTVTINAGDKFTEPGFTATDNKDGDLTDKVTVSDTYNIYKGGTYTITYTVSDAAGNTATATRKLVVKAANVPAEIAPEGATIYLTFDDGPGPYTRQLLDVLKKYNVKATFFVCDRGQYNSIMKDIADEGHAIAIHTQSHTYEKIYASEDAFFQDHSAMRNLIHQITGIETTLMRFPGGSSNMVSRFNPGIMTRLTQAVEAKGFQYFDWNVDSKDAGGAKTADEVFQNVVNGCSGRKASVVLQHDIHKYSVDAVERIIQWGIEHGYAFSKLEPTSPKAHHGVNN